MGQFKISLQATWHVLIDGTHRISEWENNRSAQQCHVKAKMLQAKFHRDVALAWLLDTLTHQVLHY